MEPIKIVIPLGPQEISFKQFLDLKTKEQEFFKIGEEEGLEEEEKISKQLEKILEALEIVCRGDLRKLPFSFKEDNFSQMFRDGYLITEGENVSLLRLYCHIINSINSYKPVTIPETFGVMYWEDLSKTKKVEYTISRERGNRSLKGSWFSTGEVIEVLEIQRLTKEAAKEKGDPLNNLAFNLGLHELAIILRRPLEELPLNKGEREDFIDQRKKLFEDMPLDVVLNVRFFLASILID